MLGLRGKNGDVYGRPGKAIIQLITMILITIAWVFDLHADKRTFDY